MSDDVLQLPETARTCHHASLPCIHIGDKKVFGAGRCADAHKCVAMPTLDNITGAYTVFVKKTDYLTAKLRGEI